MDDKLIKFFEKNRQNSDALSMKLLIYSMFIEKKDINEKQLYLFLDKKETESLNEKQKKELSQEIIKSFNNLKNEQQLYLEWIKNIIKENILKVKMNQINLSKQERLKVNQNFATCEEKKQNFNFSKFALNSISTLDDFLDLLDLTEPLFLKIYRNEKSFFDTDFVNIINETSFLNDDAVEFLSVDFLKKRTWNMKNEIKDELYEEMFKKINKEFLWPQTSSNDTLFSILGKITKTQLALFSNFIRGGMKIA